MEAKNATCRDSIKLLSRSLYRFQKESKEDRVGYRCLESSCFLSRVVPAHTFAYIIHLLSGINALCLSSYKDVAWDDLGCKGFRKIESHVFILIPRLSNAVKHRLCPHQRTKVGHGEQSPSRQALFPRDVASRDMRRHHATPCDLSMPLESLDRLAIQWPRLQPERAQMPRFASQSHLLPARRCLGGAVDVS